MTKAQEEAVERVRRIAERSPWQTVTVPCRDLRTLLAALDEAEACLAPRRDGCPRGANP